MSESFRKYSRILTEKGEIEKIILLAFKKNPIYTEPTPKQVTFDEENKNSLSKEMNDYFYKKFHCKELNDSKLIFLKQKKTTESIQQSLASIGTEIKSLSHDFHSSYVMSPGLQNYDRKSEIFSPSLKKRTKHFTNISKPLIEQTYENIENPTSSPKRKKKEIFSSLESNFFFKKR